MKAQRSGFGTLDTLRGDQRHPVDIDAGTLIFVCAIRHKEAYNSGDYTPAARNF